MRNLVDCVAMNVLRRVGKGGRGVTSKDAAGKPRQKAAGSVDVNVALSALQRP